MNFRGWIAVVLLLASWSAAGGCLDDLRHKTTLNGQVSSLDVEAALQTVCTLLENDTSLLDAVVFDPSYENAHVERDWTFKRSLKLGKPALRNHDVMQFIVAHEMAHLKQSHTMKRALRHALIILLGLALFATPISLIIFKNYKWLIPATAFAFGLHISASWWEFSSYIEDEHEADLEGVRLLAVYGFSPDSGVRQFLEQHFEQAPSFMDSYFTWPGMNSLRRQNPHPSTYARKARISSVI